MRPARRPPEWLRPVRAALRREAAEARQARLFLYGGQWRDARADRAVRRSAGLRATFRAIEAMLAFAILGAAGVLMMVLIDAII